MILWWLANLPLRREAHDAISRPQNTAYVSAASAWEIGIKVALGKLSAPDDLIAQMRSKRLTLLTVTIQHGLAVGSLPALHSDPFDRLLIAQARIEGLTLVTRDERLAEYEVPIVAA